MHGLPESPPSSAQEHGPATAYPSSPLNPDRSRAPQQQQQPSAHYYDSVGSRGGSGLGGRDSLSGRSDASHSTGGLGASELGADLGPYSYSRHSMPSASGASSPIGRGSSGGRAPFGGSGASGYSRSESAAPLVVNSLPNTGNPGERAGERGATWTTRDALLDSKLHDDGLEDYQPVAALSARGWANMGVLVLLVGGLITLFAGYPIIAFYGQKAAPTLGAYNVGGINATGQVPYIKGLPTLIDISTPTTAYNRTGVDGSPYVLMFSDEFEIEGRTYVVSFFF